MEAEAYLAHVLVDFVGAGELPEGRIADALMAVDGVVTVNLAGDGGWAEYRVDVRAANRERARDAAVGVAHEAATAVGVMADVAAVKLQTERERLAALDGTRTLHALGFRGPVRVVD